MVVRTLQSQDIPGLLKLLKLQDEHPEYRTMSPESRTETELELELGDESPYSAVFPSVLDHEGQIVAYASLCNYHGEAFLEGPLIDPETKAVVTPLLANIVSEARKQGYAFVEAFVDEENRRAQQVLEQAGFDAFRTTYIYELENPHNPPKLKPSPFKVEQVDNVELSVYRDLYRNTSDNWATRLAWSDEELSERFEDPDVLLFLAYKDAKPVGHLELEFLGEEGFAEIAYFGVLPEYRGQGLGCELISQGVKEAFKDDRVHMILARAHDDERAACHTLEQIGFRLSHGVVAFTLELD